MAASTASARRAFSASRNDAAANRQEIFVRRESARQQHDRQAAGGRHGALADALDARLLAADLALGLHRLHGRGGQLIVLMQVRAAPGSSTPIG